jgi:chemotaxis protein methyltransferase CheR
MNLQAKSGLQSNGAGLVAGEFLLTATDFKKIAAMMRTDAGIHLPETKATLVYSRLAKRLRVLGLHNFQDYCQFVSADEGREERKAMLAALTTNVTRFFREPHHFEHLKTQVLLPLIESAKRGGKIRIWSAACSNGQEPYSIALTILALLPHACNLDIKVLATDIDPNMITDGRRGVYSESLVSEVAPDLRRKWFVPSSETDEGSSGEAPGDPEKTYAVADELRALVSFKELNLIGNWPMKGMFQAIFCRNVVIYFEQETQAMIWDRFASLLAPNGYLYIGHSERLSGPAAHAFESAGITTYRLQDARHK